MAWEAIAHSADPLALKNGVFWVVTPCGSCSLGMTQTGVLIRSHICFPNFMIPLSVLVFLLAFFFFCVPRFIQEYLLRFMTYREGVAKLNIGRVYQNISEAWNMSTYMSYTTEYRRTFSTQDVIALITFMKMAVTITLP
jgi:hypothetical protein